MTRRCFAGTSASSSPRENSTTYVTEPSRRRREPVTVAGYARGGCSPPRRAMTATPTASTSPASSGRVSASVSFGFFVEAAAPSVAGDFVAEPAVPAPACAGVSFVLADLRFPALGEAPAFPRAAPAWPSSATKSPGARLSWLWMLETLAAPAAPARRSLSLSFCTGASSPSAPRASSRRSCAGANTTSSEMELCLRSTRTAYVS